MQLAKDQNTRDHKGVHPIGQVCMGLFLTCAEQSLEKVAEQQLVYIAQTRECRTHLEVSQCSRSFFSASMRASASLVRVSARSASAAASLAASEDCSAAASSAAAAAAATFCAASSATAARSASAICLPDRSSSKLRALTRFQMWIFILNITNHEGLARTGKLYVHN